MTQAPTPGPLWMMHVIGPDDIYPAPDHATAVEWCAALNASMPKNDVLCVAVPAIWIGTLEAHAEGLSEAVQGWTSPRQRLAPAAPVEASGSERKEDALEALDWIENVFPGQGDTNDQGVTVRGWHRLDQACATIRAALSRPQPSGFLATLTDEQRTAALAHTGGDTHPQPSGETREQQIAAVMTALNSFHVLSGRVTSTQAEHVLASLAALSPAPVASGGQHSSGEGVELTFGMGALVVNTGTFGGDNAVFIAKATAPGEVGAYTGNAAFKRDVRQPSEHVLIFPTAQQAQAVADALVGAVPAQDDDKLRRAVEALEEAVAVAKVCLAAVDEQTSAFFRGQRPQWKMAAQVCFNEIADKPDQWDEALAALKSTAAQEGRES